MYVAVLTTVTALEADISFQYLLGLLQEVYEQVPDDILVLPDLFGRLELIKHLQ
jgi:hypothetical protein